MKKQVSIIGIGMDNDKSITIEAREAFEEAGLVIGARRLVELFINGNSNGLEPIGDGKVTGFVSEESRKKYVFEYKSSEIVQIIRKFNEDKVAVLMSGDTGFYSGAKGLYEELTESDEFNIIMYPGIASPVYLSSKIGIPWQDFKIVSLHGREDNISSYVAANEYTFFLLDGTNTPHTICDNLLEYELAETFVYVGENLGGEGEVISSFSPVKIPDREFSKLSVCLVWNPGDLSIRETGIEDGRFKRGKVPMTKSEVRSVILSKLKLKDDDISWDIGCGTGSVSVEMALSSPEGTVYSVDKNREACELTLENAKSFHCDNICVIEGDVADVTASLPAPDVCFIGGSGGRMAQVVDRAFAINPDVRIVITAVSLETLENAVGILKGRGINPDIVQIAVTRTKSLGNYTMFDAENPIFIISSIYRS